MASSGRVTLFHVVGLTPEAPTLDAVFPRPAPVLTFTLYQSDIDSLSAPRAELDMADLVVFGCPQMTLAEAEVIGRHLAGWRSAHVLFHMMPHAYAEFARRGSRHQRRDLAALPARRADASKIPTTASRHR